jgi:hypothetical protein
MVDVILVTQQHASTSNVHLRVNGTKYIKEVLYELNILLTVHQSISV